MKRFILFFIIGSIFSSSFGQLYQWRGQNRDGHFNESGLLKEWPEEGPKQILEIEGIGKGFSSPIATENAIYITGMIDTLDYLTALDLEGNILWQTAYGESWKESYPDSRSSPTIEENRVYVFSGTGVLSCINSANGKITWSVKVDQEFEADWHVWGIAETPLIVDDLVVCTPGGKKVSVVAFDKYTGELKWQSESLGGQRAYASPTIYEYNNIRYILAVTATHLIALEPKSGEIQWSYNYFEIQEWAWQPGLIWTNTPIFDEDEIFISKGYNHPSVMLKMDSLGTSVTEKYIDHTLDNHHHGVVLVDGHIYGSNWISNGKGKWVCMDWQTGEIKYVEDWTSKGSMVYADGLLYTYVERNGAVGLVKPNPNEFEVISSFRVTKGSGPHWAHPYILGGKLYLRHGDVLMVYDIQDNA